MVYGQESLDDQSAWNHLCLKFFLYKYEPAKRCCKVYSIKSSDQFKYAGLVERETFFKDAFKKMNDARIYKLEETIRKQYHINNICMRI